MIIVSFTSQSVDLPDPRFINAPMKPKEVCFSSHIAASAFEHTYLWRLENDSVFYTQQRLCSILKMRLLFRMV
ncbi:hypothetical protein CGGC5_v003527 [Colletotrichum fructicola Nara gc5]|uniref:Uncharacterized protein n=1 Tax=Colletotrichum fructicola (strain Nara gc5) TaxID=1213859 RepID=A0A7J6JHP8_COLFN|nr:hypothetical protein CGGC5_v003527 [Colletotrichum fructicola Nara gc5]KAF4906251.1 hypothetical protein CGCFRS4_v000119 [Colletotrichum fructicola]